MTHPLVSAFHRVEILEQADFSTFEGTEALKELNLLDAHISEVMASIPDVKFHVGFLMGYNCRVYLIWLWPLKPAWNVPDQHYQYWVYDAEWSYADGYERWQFGGHCGSPRL